MDQQAALLEALARGDEPSTGVRLATEGAIPRGAESVQLQVRAADDVVELGWAEPLWMPRQDMERGAGFRLEIFGLYPPPGVPDAWCWPVRRLGDASELDRVWYWRLRAYFGDSPVCGEVLLLPGDRPRVSIRGIERVWDADAKARREAIRRAEQGLGFLLRVKVAIRMGRRSLEETRDGWEQMADTVEADQRGKRRRTVAGWARHFGVSERTLYTWRARRRKKTGRG